MPIRLHSLDDGPSILLDKPILLLGRHPECDVQIESRKISRRHCCIAQVNDAVLIRDLDSTNGIKINGIRVQEARLAVGDEVTIGSHRYRVVAETSPELAHRPNVPVHPGRQPMPARVEMNDMTFEEDALLESSEVPIPIDEIVRDRKEPLVQTNEPAEDPSNATQGADEFGILPEELHLAPSNSENRQPSK